jgi:NADH-quinone oxidoreductase subunit C
MSLNNTTVLERIQEKAASLLIASGESADGMLWVSTTREQLLDLLNYLKTEETLQFHFLTTLCAVHYPDKKGAELQIMYQLHNWMANIRMRVKVDLSIEDPSIPSATGLWPTANWMERQEYDFFGVQFQGHPNLVRILNVDDLDVFPMRKEYKLEDGTRTDKDDRFFGRDGNYSQSFIQ